MPLYTVAELVARKDKNAMLVRQHFSNKYDNHYMQKTPRRLDDDEGEDIVINEDAAGERKIVQILCISVGFIGVRPYPSECSVIVTGGKVFVAGYEEYEKCFTL